MLGIPLVCQLLFGGILIASLHQIDSAARKESQAKHLIATCQELRAALVRYYMQVGARKFIATEKMDDGLRNFEALIQSKMVELKEDVNGNPSAETMVRKYDEDLHQVHDLFAEALVSVDVQTSKHAFARYINEGEFVEHFVECFQNIVDDEESLIAAYKPVVDEFSPRSLQNRASLREALIFGGILNTVVVFAVAMYFNKSTLRRLLALMQNISAFSAGKLNPVPVEGADEISDVDRAFRSMAQARIASDEMRRSMYAMVSHDLRSPLTSINLTLSLIIDKEASQLDSKLMTKLNRINSESARLVRLSSGFLDLEKLEDGKLKLQVTECAVRDLVEQSVYAVSGLAQSKKVELSVQESGLMVPCDADRIMEVLVNLLSNAVKFTPPNSTVAVAVVARDSNIVFEVSDQGTAIPEEQLANLFQPFSQLEGTVAGGSGLGLYVSKMLVELHGGQIGYRAREGGGSCFWFSLPSA